MNKEAAFQRVFEKRALEYGFNKTALFGFGETKPGKYSKFLPPKLESNVAEMLSTPTPSSPYCAYRGKDGTTYSLYYPDIDRKNKKAKK